LGQRAPVGFYACPCAAYTLDLCSTKHAHAHSTTITCLRAEQAWMRSYGVWKFSRDNVLFQTTLLPSLCASYHMCVRACVCKRPHASAIPVRMHAHKHVDTTSLHLVHFHQTSS